MTPITQALLFENTEDGEPFFIARQPGQFLVQGEQRTLTVATKSFPRNVLATADRVVWTELMRD